MKKPTLYTRSTARWLSPLAIAAAAALLTARVEAGDWPQILGPARNGVAVGESLATSWKTGGPKQLWAKSIGMGYASATVRGEHVIVFHRIGREEIVESLDLDGKSRWKRAFPAYYRGGVNSDLGPRSTPVIDGEDIFALGAAGDLYCVALADGKPRWTRSLFQDYKAPDGYFGAGSAPLVIGDRVLVNVGGRGAGLVAVNRKTGETIWKKTNEGASYSAPTKLPWKDGVAALFVTRLNAVCIDPANGDEHFRFPFGMTGPTVNAATPLYRDGHIFLTASYGVGADMRRVGPGVMTKVWANDESLSSQYATPVFHKGFLFGSHGREDIGEADFRCIDAKTGAVKWTKSYGVAHVIRSGDLLLTQSVRGRIELLRANPQRYEQLASAQVADGETKALPALANGRLYVRVNGPNGKLICVEVGK